MLDHRDKGDFRLRPAGSEDRAFLVEMAQHACSLEDRPLLARDDPDVVALLPASPDEAIVAVNGRGAHLGAIWFVFHEPPLVLDEEGDPLPELAIAVVEDERRKGIGRALLDAMVERV